MIPTNRVSIQARIDARILAALAKHFVLRASSRSELLRLCCVELATVLALPLPDLAESIECLRAYGIVPTQDLIRGIANRTMKEMQGGKNGPREMLREWIESEQKVNNREKNDGKSNSENDKRQ